MDFFFFPEPLERPELKTLGRVTGKETFLLILERT